MIDFEFELNEMIAVKNLMNSYKLYFLKAIIMNASNDNKEFTFHEMACWMCAYSFGDVCSVGKRIRPLDKLYDTAVLAIEKEKLMESSRIIEIYDAVNNTKDKELRKMVASLCNYVPYRLLAYLWPVELMRKTDRQKNQLIEELSQGDNRSIYTILSDPYNKKIVINEGWSSYIKNHRKKLISWINEKIDAFVWRRQ